MSSVPNTNAPLANDVKPPKPRLWFFGLVVVAITLPWLLWALKPAAIELPVMGELIPWSLTSHDNAPFGSTQLAKKPYVTSFFFTSCPTTCPKIMKAMKSVHDRTDELQLVSITVDPETDTPDVLRRSLQKYDANPKRWTLCTGTEEQIHGVVVDGFKTYVGKRVPKTADVYDIVHGARLVLVDGEGQVRGHFATDESGLNELVEAAKSLQ